ncbi:unnamed protein product, partial [marine sediment metagenome]
MSNYTSQLRDLLALTIQQQASDLHISVGHPPTLRVIGRLVPLVKMKKILPEDSQGLAFELMHEDQRQRFLQQKEIDFSYNFEDKDRFRVNIFFQKGNISAALRLIPAKIQTIEELNLSPVLHEFTKPNQGFVLITGPSSHGKSTTLAALIDEINHTRTDHIIT